MRTIIYEINKASFDRLSLLKDIPVLPLPFDPAIIRPFDIKVNDFILYISHQGKDLAYLRLGNEGLNGNQMNIITTYPEDRDLDKIVFRLVKRLSSYVDECGKLIREQVRQRKKEEVKHQPFAEIKGDVSRVIEMDAESFRQLKNVMRNGDEWSISGPHVGGLMLFFDQSKGQPKPLRYTVDEKNPEKITLTPDVNNEYILDGDLIKKAIQERIERSERVYNPDNVRDFLNLLPDAEYSSLLATMNSPAPKDTALWQDEILNLSQERTIHISWSGVTLLQEKLKLLSLDLSPRYTSGWNLHLPHCVMASSTGAHNLVGDEDKEKLESLWAGYMARKMGVDPDKFRNDFHEVPLSFEDDDLEGYNL